MNRSSHPLRRTPGLAGRTAGGVLLLLPLMTPAQAAAQAVPAPPGAAPATAPASPEEANRPLLRELDRETRELYGQLQGGVLRVQIPEPQWARNSGPRNNWITEKYRDLNPEVRQQLQGPAISNSVSNSAGNSTTPSQGSALNNSQQPGPATGQAPGGGAGSNGNYDRGANEHGANEHGNGEHGANEHGNGDRRGGQGLTILVPPPDASRIQQQAAPNDRQPYAAPVQAPAQPPAPGGPAFSPNNIGLLLDEQGHVLVPQYVDRDALGDQPIRLTSPSGEVIDARLVGSDAQTGLTVLQRLRPADRSANADKPAKDASGKAADAKPADADHSEKPVVLARSRPADGSLVLLLSPGDGAGRLAVWNGGGRDYGVVVNLDGRVAGITRSGQFLGGPACQLIADQIIRNGAVRRATLGVIITQIEKDDPARTARPLLGDRPAVRVDQVILHSVADRGGLRVGDVLLALEGEPATDIPAVAAAIAARNGPTRLRVLRGEKVVELTVDLQQK